MGNDSRGSLSAGLPREGNGTEGKSRSWPWNAGPSRPFFSCTQGRFPAPQMTNHGEIEAIRKGTRPFVICRYPRRPSIPAVLRFTTGNTCPIRRPALHSGVTANRSRPNTSPVRHRDQVTRCAGHRLFRPPGRWGVRAQNTPATSARGHPGRNFSLVFPWWFLETRSPPPERGRLPSAWAVVPRKCHGVYRVGPRFEVLRVHGAGTVHQFALGSIARRGIRPPPSVARPGFQYSFEAPARVGRTSNATPAHVIFFFFFFFFWYQDVELVPRPILPAPENHGV